MENGKSEIHLYGEDGLTLWALTTGKPQLAKKLGVDESEIEHVFYRPSFGRGGGKACFGEFDAIVSTKSTVYLIESKWYPKERKNTKEKIRLPGNQVKRHCVMKRIIDEGSKYDHNADEKQLLRSNLEFLLKIIERENIKIIKNILLVFGRNDITQAVLKYTCPECKRDVCFTPISWVYNDMENEFVDEKSNYLLYVK